MNVSIDLILSNGIINHVPLLETIYNQVNIFFGRILITKKVTELWDNYLTMLNVIEDLILSNGIVKLRTVIKNL